MHLMLGSLIFLTALSTAGPASAATIYGSLTGAKKPLGGAAVQLICGRMESAGQSDARGYYNLSIAASGRCVLSVNKKTAQVNLGSQPARYDFEVPATGTELMHR